MKMLNELIEKRYSPYSFSDRQIEKGTIYNLFDTARFSPSAYNEQPWRFIIASKSNEEIYNNILETLVDANKEWAKQASSLILTIAQNNFSKNGKKNYHAEYDLGQSVAYLTLKATELDIFVHQMSGFSRDKAIELFNIPEGYTPVSVIALGYKNIDDQKPEKGRKEISEFVFENSF
ncbi:MAG TPA: nitroreductase [Ignavibacteria bacterium]|nr:nitroreductase [Ignavibacteria bacterium]